jgi:hypothetical protein
MNSGELDVEPKKYCAGKTSWNRSSWENLGTPKQAGRVNCFEKSLSNTGRTALPCETRNQTENCPSGARHRRTTRGERNRTRPRAPSGGGKMNQFQKQKLRETDRDHKHSGGGGKNESVSEAKTSDPTKINRENQITPMNKNNSQTTTEVTVLPLSFNLLERKSIS